MDLVIHVLAIGALHVIGYGLIAAVAIATERDL